MMQLRGMFILSTMALLAACNGDAAPVADPVDQASAASAVQVAVPVTAAVTGPERRILAFGDSLFAAYGLEKQQGYPARLQAALRAQGINAVVTDAGVSGDTTAAGKQRISFALDAAGAKPDLAIVELGGNDLLRAISPAETRENLKAILDELQRRDIPVLLMGMRAPPNMGADFVAEFDGIYPALARDYDAALVPFFLEPTYSKPQLIQQDRIHPTAEGIEALVASTADDVVAALPKRD